jgi:hypothetical protein
MRSIGVALGLCLAVGACAPAWSQGGMNDACVNQVNGAYDAVASQNWQQHFRNTDRQALQMIAGTWYTEIPNQQLGMIAYTYESYQPTQIFDYRQRTCGATGCSDAYGTGMFGAETQADGSVFVTRNFSDNNRRNACGGFFVRFIDRNTMVTREGSTYRRAQ